MNRFTKWPHDASQSLTENVRLVTWSSANHDDFLQSHLIDSTETQDVPAVTSTTPNAQEHHPKQAHTVDVRALRVRVSQLETDCNGYKEAYDKACTELSRFRDLLRLTDVPNRRGRQIVFLHIQKTAGNSVLKFVGRQFAWFKTLQAFSPAEFDAYHPAEIAHFDLVSGHFTARNLSSARPGALLMTFLREPVDRVLSTYWYFRTYEKHPRDSIRHAVEAAKSKSLMDFLHDPTPEVRRHVVNHQAFSLAGDWLNPDDRSDSQLLADALHSLRRFDCVGITENLSSGIRQLCRLMDWRPPDVVERDNVTTYRDRVGDLAPSAVEAIRELNSVDIALYRVARAKAKLAEADMRIRSEPASVNSAELVRCGNA